MKSLKKYMNQNILYFLIPLIVSIFFLNFNRMNTQINNDFKHQEEILEQAIFDSIEFVNNGFLLISDLLSPEIERESQYFLEEYVEVEGDISLVNLSLIKENIESNLGRGEVDLYIINRTGVIVKTTYAPDLGLDFILFPSFYQSLMTIFENGVFVNDLVIPETQAGKLRMFSYLPTPDGQYILEIGLLIEGNKDIIENYNYIDTAKELEKISPYLKTVRFFSPIGVLIGNSSYNTSNEIIEICNNAYRLKENYTFYDKSLNIRKEYIFIEIMYENYPSDNSIIIEVIYNENLRDQELLKNTLIHLFFSLISIIIISFGISYVSAYLTNPIHDMIANIEEIERGHYNASINLTDPKKVLELEKLAKSTNSMLSTIKQNMKDIQESELKYRGIIENMQNVYFRLDSRNLITIISPSALNMLHYKTHDELINHDIGKIINSNSNWQEIQKILESKKEISQYEIELISQKKKKIPVLISCRYYYKNNDVAGIEGIFIDITERKNTQKILIEKERLSAIGEAASSTAHDFNNALHGILANVELAKLFVDDPLLVQEHLITARHLIEDSAARINQLQLYTKGLSLPSKKSIIKLNKLIQDVIAETKHLWQASNCAETKYIKIHIDLDVDVEISGNIGELRSVLFNIIKNSVEAISDDGYINIKTFKKSDNEIILSIADNGVGMDDSTKNNIFTPFYSTKSNKGMGLGMNIAQRIINEHLGNIYVKYSKPSKGTIIEISLPSLKKK